MEEEISIYAPVYELEEGGFCPCCGGTLIYPLPENCSCHVNPPCSQCTSILLTCEECYWEEGMKIDKK